MKVLFYDLETTGIDHQKCGIVQLAAILIDIGTDGVFTIVDAINLKMKPSSEKTFEKRALEVNGLTMEDINGFQDQSSAFEKFVAFLDKHVDRFSKAGRLKLAGYNNMHFDADYLNDWFIENGNAHFYSYFYIDQIDVMCEASRYLLFYRDGMNNIKLATVAQVLGIELDKDSLHDAFYDIKLTIKVFKKIIAAGTAFMPFDQDLAIKMFVQQQQEKKKLEQEKANALLFD